ncbi:MAG: prolipoprotein diacylglyceryl transferase, partial [Halarsenatibacteraceae bacterium]
LIAGIIYTYFFIKKKEFDFLTTVDILAPAFILGQSIGRWGNFINQEAYGQVVSQETLSWLPQFIQEGMYINGAYHQPTFLYESIWNLIVFIVMIVLFKSKYYKSGRVLGVYLIAYSIGRFFIEDLRIDSLYLGNIQVARLISIAMIAAGAYLFYWTMESGKGKN